MVLPLRLWLRDNGQPSAAQLAHTVDISEGGCRLGGLRRALPPGQVVTLQRGQQKADFRVIWTRELEPNENQAGIEALDSGLNIWLAGAEQPKPAPVAAKAERPGTRSSAVRREQAMRAVSQGERLKCAPAAVMPSTLREKLMQALASRGLRWRLTTGFALGLLTIGLYQYLAFSARSRDFAFEIPAPTPPNEEDLARFAPKAHPLPGWLTKPLAPSVSRLQVAEAPTGRIVYPVPPDDLNTGKVQLQIVVAANGWVKQIHLLSGRQPLALAAAQAVKLWHYAALTATDSVHERETTVTVSFLGPDAVSLQFPRASTGAMAPRNN